MRAQVLAAPDARLMYAKVVLKLAKWTAIQVGKWGGGGEGGGGWGGEGSLGCRKK